MPLPDEIWMYEPHKHGFARYGDKWYQILAIYPGWELMTNPTPVHRKEVLHPNCKLGCVKTVIAKEGNKMVKEPPLGTPPKLQKPRLRPSLTILVSPQMVAVLAMVMVCCTVIVVTFGGGGVVRKVRAAGARPPQPPQVGDVHYNEKGWWKITEVISKESADVDTAKRGYMSQLSRQGVPIITYDHTVSEKEPPRRYYLVVQQAQPPNSVRTLK